MEQSWSIGECSLIDYDAIWDNENMTVFVRYEEKEYTVEDWIAFCNKKEDEE